jgi:hypothetical protein
MKILLGVSAWLAQAEPAKETHGPCDSLNSLLPPG